MSTPLMGLILPTDGGSANVWDTILDTVFGVIDGHNHTTGQGAPIPVAALNVNADLAMSSGGAHFSLTQLLAVQLTPSSAASVSGYTNALFANSSDNNLYWRNNAGTNVQVTAGNSLNVAGFVGGIGGDYTSVSALLSYDDASKNYWLQQEVVSSHRPWAGLETADVSIFQKASSITQSVTLKSPNSLAASYTLTMPTALPATTSPLSVSSAGAVSTTSSFVLSLPPAAFDLNSNTRSSTIVGMLYILLSGGVNNFASGPVVLKEGCTITGVTAYVDKVTDATNTINVGIVATSGTAGTDATTAVGTNSANAPGFVTITSGAISVPTVAGTFVTVIVGMTGGAGTTDRFYGVEITYTSPVG